MFKLWRSLLRAFFESSSIQSSDERIEVSQFSMATLECANLGGANMRVVRGSRFWQLSSIASLARETMGGGVLVAVWPKHGLRSGLRCLV